MNDIEINRSAIETMMAAAAVAADSGITFERLDVKPYRGSSHVRALASFTGPSGKDVVEDLSSDIGERIATGFGASWTFADRIEVDMLKGGFQLTVGFDTTPAAVL